MKGIDNNGDMQEVEDTTKDLLERVRHRKPSEIRSFITQLPNHVLKKIFPKEEDFTTEEVLDAHYELISDDTVVFERVNPACENIKELLPAACKRGDLDTVKLLLFHEVDPSFEGIEGTPLEVATFVNQREIIDVLLKWKPDLINDIPQVKNCLAKACQGGHQDLVAFWLEKLKAVSGRKLSSADFVTENDPVIAACKGNHPEQVANQLLEEEVFFINKETIDHAGEKLARCLEAWVEECNEPGTNKTLSAKWSDKHLYTFAPVWLQLSKYDNCLTNIDLSHNALGTIPGLLLWGLPWLEKLTLSHNNIDKLPTLGNIQKLHNSRLTFLTLSNNMLKEVPTEIFMLPNLETLSLPHNRINKFQLANIELRVANQNSTKPVWRCQSLKQLDLSHNHLTSIPSDIQAAMQLTKLYIASNKLTAVPKSWFCQLEKLNARDNCISVVPDIHVHWQKSLKILDLSKNKLTEIPLTLCRLSGLLDLNVSANQIRDLPSPKEWCTLRLSVLDLSHNELFHIKPDQCLERPGNTNSLGSSLARNLLKKLSGDKAMEQPTTEPTTVFYVNLDPTEAKKVQLEFPKIFSDSVCTLNLSYNKLQAFPDGICEMRTLQMLDIRGNPDVDQLPAKLSNLRDLYSIKLDEHQIIDPPELEQVIIESAGNKLTMAIKRLLREKLHNSKHYRGVKLMMVGPQKSGKTSLMTQMLGCDWPEEDHGVNVKEWQICDPSTIRRLRRASMSQLQFQGDIDFSLWDLKGGEDYALVHQTLFTPRTMYLVVWDVSEKELGIQKLRPWILNIRSRAPQSCVIAVGTHVDLLPKSSTREDLIARITQQLCNTYPEIAECIVMESTGYRGSTMMDLKQTIHKRASEMTYFDTHPIREEGPLVGRMVPRSYSVLQDLLKISLTKMKSCKPPKPPIMTEAELKHHFNTIPGSHLMKSEESDAAVRFLRDTGCLTHVSDQTYQLTNLYFLDPTWLCNVLRAVVTFKTQDSYTQDGMVLNRDLKKLCVESGFGESRFEEYLQLLARFEIAFPVTTHRCLIPSLLPKRPPFVQHFSTSSFNHRVQRLYKMAYIPPGFWSRLVARVMVSVKQIEDEGQLKRYSSVKRFSQDILMSGESHSTTLVWQEGMSLNHDRGQFSIEPLKFPDQQHGIRVTVRSHMGDFKVMGFIVDHIESLIKEWYPGLDESDDVIERLVLCPVCEGRLAQTEGPYGCTDVLTTCGMFSFKELAVACTLRGQDHVSCSKHEDENVSLKVVVPDLFLSDLNLPYLDESKLIVGKKLGQGGFGEVFKAAYRGEQVALKRLLKLPADGNMPSIDNDTAISDEEILAVVNTFPDLRSELAIMSQLNHPCILRAIGVSIHQLCFAMEFAPLGDLSSYIRDQYIITRPIMLTQKVLHETILPRMLTYKIAFQITTAIAYIHHRRVIHTDLKTDNILLFSTDTEDLINVKLADYGISRNLAAGGTRGKAGLHAFTAPEIVKGKAFDEKADLFSLGMLFYHVISGLIPFDDESSIETKVNITTGNRPKFEHIEYAMLPRFAHLEALMKKCWQDSPIDRPSAQNALKVMQDASFLCLRHHVEVESESEACLYTQEAAAAQDEKEKCDLWLWKKAQKERCVTSFNFEYNTTDQETKEWPGDKVLCAVQFGDYHVLGTRSEKLQIFKYNRQTKRLTHQTDLMVLNQVAATSLYYYHVADQGRDSLQGYLFVGLEDGTLLIYSHLSMSMSTTITISKSWKLKKSLLLSVDPKPCHCMHLVKHRHELLIGCGNTVRILNLDELLLDQQLLVVDTRDDQVVQGLANHGDMVWCFVEDSSDIPQFDLSTRQMVNKLYCSSTVLTKGHCLSNPVSDRASRSALHSLPVSPPSNAMELPSFRDRVDVLTSRPRSLTSSVSRRAAFVSRKQKSRSAGDYTENYNVSSILTVKDTLWVGRADGNILVVGIDTMSSRYRFGEVLAVLSPLSMLGVPEGPVSKLQYVEGSGRVIACRDIAPDVVPIGHGAKVFEDCSTKAHKTHFVHTGKSTIQLKPEPFRYQLLVWEDWGSQEVMQFEKAHEVLKYERH